jgi:hypothetical protein
MKAVLVSAEKTEQKAHELLESIGPNAKKNGILTGYGEGFGLGYHDGKQWHTRRFFVKEEELDTFTTYATKFNLTVVKDTSPSPAPDVLDSKYLYY